MKISHLLLGAFAGSVAVLSFGSLLVADQLRYMDNSGNIHFVDHLSQVPSQYRLQLITPTPEPVLDKRALAEMKRVQRDEEAERKRKEGERQREIKRRQIEIQRRRDQEERELRRHDDSRKVDRFG